MRLGQLRLWVGMIKVFGFYKALSHEVKHKKVVVLVLLAPKGIAQFLSSYRVIE
jgi:hypothetical protein